MSVEGPRNDGFPSYREQARSAFNKVYSFVKTREIRLAIGMMGVETLHDINLVPQQYGLTRDQVGPLLTSSNPSVSWALNNFGDIFEISAGYIGARGGLMVLNETLRRIPAFKGYQISDETSYWLSLTATEVFKLGHTLGLYSILGYHDHMGHPVPGLIFGQGIAIALLTAVHYAPKYKEPIGKFILKIGAGVKGLDS